MITWLVSRHPGAVEWARRQGVPIDRVVAHLSPADVRAGDTVIGTLPVNLAAAVCQSGAQYLHVSLELPAHLRGHELSADQLEALGARLEAFRIELLPPP
ncbi:MAG: CRISPR-associated protein Csx16 [Burkholderiaceae bacterium]